MSATKGSRTIRAIKVPQWLSGWNKVAFDQGTHRRKPEPHFFIFSLPAAELRSLCGIFRRDTRGLKAREEDLGIQRRHDPERSEEINRFVEFGYPWSDLSERKRKSAEFHDLRKPGWLPTSIVVNILTSSDQRQGGKVSTGDLITVRDDDHGGTITLPYTEWSKEWRPSAVSPIEVIDGQHRLWAFDSGSSPAGFELPVVAFHGLDISWQAYLFWTINIKPKRINASLAFDLYPLLRAEDWLDRGEGHSIYRETRSQELTEALWANPESPWYDRINMLGEPKIRWVSQAAWVRSLMATFVRTWEARGSGIGGLFGSRVEESDHANEVLGWSRAQQAAFLIFSWRSFYASVHESRDGWARSLRHEKNTTGADDTAFYGTHSLIATDQGVRGFLHVLNDLCFAVAAKLKFRAWNVEGNSAASDEKAVTNAIKSLNKTEIGRFVDAITAGLSSFDWRTSTALDLSERERQLKLIYRGSGGYREMRKELLKHLQNRSGLVGTTAVQLISRS